MSFFQTNLSAQLAKNPNFANQLMKVDEVEDFEIFMDENDVSTLNFVNTKNFTPLYENTPAQSIIDAAEHFKMFEQYPYLYMYGLGNGILLKHLLENKNLKRIVVVEPELELAYVVLHMVDFSQEIESGRLVLFSKDEANFPNILALFTTLDEQRYVRVYDLHINTSYYEKVHHEHLQRTNQIFLEALYHAVNSVGNDTTDALIGLKHHISNLPLLLETPPLVDLLNKLNTTDTAVLVSTGPSLTKQLPLLKEIAPYVRIIAVDASFPVLYEAGIKPDVVVSMERVKESARFFEQVPKEGYTDVVTVLSSLQHKDVVCAPKGGTVTMSLRPLGYMIASGPKEWGYLGIGSSAANMAFELIYYSRFKNCILIGQDLAYAEDGTSHAKGHVFGENDVEVAESDVWVKGWGGTKVRTNHNWTMFRNFFEKDLADIKDDMRTINATEGGASILGTQELAFSEAISLCVPKNSTKKTLLLQKMPAKELEICTQNTWANIDAIVVYVRDLLEELKALFLEVAMVCDVLDAGKEVEISHMQALLAHAQKIKARKDEKMYEQVVWHIAQSMMLVQEMNLAPTEVYLPKNEEEKTQKMKALMQEYRPWLFSFAAIMDAILKTISYARARTLINTVHEIGVYVKNEKIDTIKCENFTAQIGRVFDVDMRGILYDVSDVYQDKIDTISFRDAKSQTELPAAFVSVFSRNDDKYNELSFMKSLEEPIDEKSKLTHISEKNIGFLATEENLKDSALIDYFYDLLEKIKYFSLHIFYFNEIDKEKAVEIFDQYKSRIESFKIDSIGLIVEKSNIIILTHLSVRNYQIFSFLRLNTKLVTLHFSPNAKMMTIESIKEIHKLNHHPLLVDPKYFGFTASQLEEANFSIHKTLYSKYFGVIDENQNLYEFAYIRLVDNIFKNNELRDFIVNYLRLEHLYNCSRN
jgi:hypothetical protein